MRINSIYIMLDDGRCIFNEYYTPEAPPKNLVTGMLTALQGFVRELTGSYPTILSAGGFTFYFDKRGPLTVVLTTARREYTLTELSQLSLRFIQRFGDKINDWKGNVDLFETFSEDVEDILGPQSVVKRIDPELPLDALTLINLDPELLDIAKTMIEQREISSENMKDITGENEFLTRLKLEKLVKMGHLGRYQKEDKYFYFTS